MSAPLAEQLKFLERIQELDLRIDQLHREKSAQPSALQALQSGVVAAGAAVAKKREALESLEKALRQARAGIELNRDRIARASRRLEGIQNSIEYNAMTKEMEQLQTESAALEKQAAQAEAEIASARTELDGLSKREELVRVGKDEEVSKMAQKSGNLDAEIASLLSERARLAQEIEPRTVAAYDRVRTARGGIGMAAAEGGRCKGCNMAVPAQLFNEILKRSALHTCPSCHRILFARS